MNPSMRIEYQLTARDMQLAADAVENFFSDGSTKARSKPRRLRVYDLICFALVAVLVFLAMESAGPRPKDLAATHNFWLTVMLPLIAPLLVTAFLWSSLLRRMGPQRIPYYTGRPGYWAANFRNIAFVAAPLLLATAILLFTAFASQFADWSPSRQVLVLVTLLPWTAWLWFVRFGIYTMIGHRGAQPELGAEGGILRHPQTLETNDDGVSITSVLCRFELFWCYFVSYLESPEHFLLFTKDLRMQVIPLRAFAGPDEIDAFRLLLQQHIARGEAFTESHGFPVISGR
ncbi:MAG: YcxB-like protein [Phycisphaerales bacterium]|nr:YcxB-like protein [Phycisphaerales bacterium]